jgi:3-hydroxyisobutyrate dehydrogenase-like beta-hydroxyacid dehydrogenase
METIKAGFIGLGNLGGCLCRSLVKTSGLPVTVYDMNKAVVQEMVALGAAGANSPREVAEASDIIVSLVRDARQNNQVIFGDNGLWEGLKSGKILVISSTVGPQYMKDLYKKAKEKKVKVVDAAVTKITTNKMGFPHNYEGWATLMVGGDDDDVKRCMPVLRSMARYVIHLGGPGAGQAGKLVNNEATTSFTAITRLCFIEYLNLGLKAGLDMAKMVEVWGAGVGGPKLLETIGLKPWNTNQEIKEVLKARTGTPPVFYDVDVKTPVENFNDMYRRLAMEMALDVKANMPINNLLGELGKSESATYDAFSKEMEK